MNSKEGSRILSVREKKSAKLLSDHSGTLFNVNDTRRKPFIRIYSIQYFLRAIIRFLSAMTSDGGVFKGLPDCQDPN